MPELPAPMMQTFLRLPSTRQSIPTALVGQTERRRPRAGRFNRRGDGSPLGAVGSPAIEPKLGPSGSTTTKGAPDDRKTSFRPSPALVISCIALFIALTGSAIAAGVLGKNTVRSPQIVDGTVRNVDLHDGAVAASKISPTPSTDQRSPKTRSAAPRSRPSPSPAQTWRPRSPPRGPDQSLDADDLGPNSVGSSELQAGAVRRLGARPDHPGHQQHRNRGRRQRQASTVNCPAGHHRDQRRRPARQLRSRDDLARSGNNNGWHRPSETATPQRATPDASFAYCLAGGTSN